MKRQFKSYLTLLAVLSTLIISPTEQATTFIDPQDYKISPSKDNLGYWLITLTASKYTDLSRDERQQLITKMIDDAPDEFIYIEKSDDPNFNLPRIRMIENTQNWRRNQILFYFHEPRTLESGMELKLGLQSGVQRRMCRRRTLASEFTLASQYKTIQIPVQWVPKNDWKATFYELFQWITSITALMKLYLLFVRPALNPVHKLPIAWLASTILSFQIIYNVVYIPGNFRGVIDAAHSGIVTANNEIVGYDLRGSELYPEFYTRSTGLFMNKYSIYGYTPNPLLTSMTEVVAGVFFVLFPWFAMAFKNKRLSKISKEMKTGFVLGNSLPLITNSIACIINVVVIAAWDWFSVISFCSSVIIITLLFLEIWKMTIPDQRHSFYFNNEEGILSLDCHLLSKVPFIIR